MDRDQKYQRALERIAECRKTRSKSLDLSGLIVDRVPDEVQTLDWLEVLDLSFRRWDSKREIHVYTSEYGHLSSVPDWLMQLPLTDLRIVGHRINKLNPLSGLHSLQTLYCHHNQVNDLSPLSGLHYLQTLRCDSNQVSDLSPLCDLHSLQILDCESNQVKDLIPLNGLHNLHTLYCESNQVKDLIPLSGLHSLHTLYCEANQVSDLSPLHSLIESHQLVTLRIHRNPVTGLPAELLDENLFENMATDIRAFLLDLKQGSTTNRAIKVLLVGNGCVGKTTLVKNLLSAQPASVALQDRTHGIVIEHWLLALDDGSTVDIQLWDFGGQEIFHATHRLFAQDRALYLLLWAEQTDEDPLQAQHSVIYWLDFIGDLAPNSRIILVKNQIDRSDQYAFPPELNNDMSAFADQEKICALQALGLESLTLKIKQQIHALRRYWDFPFPQSWLTVQNQLVQRCADKTIAWTAFTIMCEQAGMSNPPVLVRYLHATGFLFYQENKMDNRLILDQNWMINMIYRVFDHREAFFSEIQRMDGVIPGSYTERIWSETEQSEREIYLQFMCASNIAFEIDHQWRIPFEQREYVIPALLPKILNTPWPSAEWIAELQYPFLHRSIIERVIIALASLSVDRQWWRNGIRLQDSENKCLLELDATEPNTGPNAEQGVLRIRLHGGNNQDKIISFSRVLDCLENIHHHQRQPLVAWSLNGVDFVNVEALQQARSNKETHVASRTAKVLELSMFAGIPDQFDDKQHFPKESAVSNTPKLFISYSHKDAEYKDELLNRLKVISRQFNVDTWHDEQLLAGDKIDPEIIKQLDVADMVIMLISPDFIASDYCFETEMQRALENAEQRSSRVIPIIVRETPDWHQHAIGQDLALPDDGKPLEDWPSADKFWGSVQTGIRRVIEDFVG
jgi:small GTP-binding protein